MQRCRKCLTCRTRRLYRKYRRSSLYTRLRRGDIVGTSCVCTTRGHNEAQRRCRSLWRAAGFATQLVMIHHVVHEHIQEVCAAAAGRESAQAAHAGAIVRLFCNHVVRHTVLHRTASVDACRAALWILAEHVSATLPNSMVLSFICYGTPTLMCVIWQWITSSSRAERKHESAAIERLAEHQVCHVWLD